MKTLEDIPCAHPQTIDEAVSLLAESPAPRIIAGGTDLIVQWQAGALPLPEKALSLLAIPELRGISRDGDLITIGANTTHAQIKTSPVIREGLPALAAAAATVGALQIQNRGTLGGNIANASPAGDTAPALLITDGHVIVTGPNGERRIALTDFFLDYRKIDLALGEFITRFELPALPAGSRELFRKLGTRGAQAISKTMAACRLRLHGNTIEHFAIAMGSVAPTTIRLPRLEKWITGQTLTPELIDEAEKRASDEVTPIADIRSTAQYRKWVSGRIVRGFLAS
jgi:carbon-monoxide dehydrogenase medium subunit